MIADAQKELLKKYNKNKKAGALLNPASTVNRQPPTARLALLQNIC